MTEEFWRPLGFDGDAAADYDVLNDGVPEWMAESFWQWVAKRFSVNRRHSGSSGWYTNFDPNLLRDAEQVCRIQAPYTGYKVNEGMSLLRAVAPKSGSELRVADYVLSLGRPGGEPDLLEEVLRQSGSRWTVGPLGLGRESQDLYDGCPKGHKSMLSSLWRRLDKLGRACNKPGSARSE